MTSTGGRPALQRDQYQANLQALHHGQHRLRLCHPFLLVGRARDRHINGIGDPLALHRLGKERNVERAFHLDYYQVFSLHGCDVAIVDFAADGIALFRQIIVNWSIQVGLEEIVRLACLCTIISGTRRLMLHYRFGWNCPFGTGELFTSGCPGVA